MTDRKVSNITWHASKIEHVDRVCVNKHGSCVVWLTGLSGAGKSTLAYEVERWLFQRGVRSYVLDGDNMRHGLNRDLGFSPDDRAENIRRIGEVSSLFVDAGLVTIVSLISPYQADRDMVRAMFSPGAFLEVYVKCGVRVCAERDPKGLYKKAMAGEIPNFTGVSAPYEEPEHPELVVDTEMRTLAESVQMIIGELDQRGILQRTLVASG